MSAALRALLEHVVDYAGLYPPAALDVPTTARNYAAYRTGADQWMLGRFVVGVAKLPELRAFIGSMRPPEAPWPVTVVAPDAAAATAVIRGNDDGAIRVESIEVKAKSPGDIVLLGRAATKKREVYVEVALDESLDAMLDAVAVAKLRAKLRTGGVTAEAIPSTTDVVRFIRACIDRGLAFKATAGLHHPLRGTYKLTNAKDARSAPMFGFFNVFLATTLMRGTLTNEDAAALLEESDATSFSVQDQSIGWRDRVADLETILATRAKFATSFGSCSFREPVDELPFSAASV